jgi:hypothetical protein
MTLQARIFVCKGSVPFFKHSEVGRRELGDGCGGLMTETVRPRSEVVPYNGFAARD